MTNEEREELIANLSRILQNQVGNNMNNKITEELATGLCHINNRAIGVVVKEAIATTEEEEEEAKVKAEEEVTDDTTGTIIED